MTAIFNNDRSSITKLCEDEPEETDKPNPANMSRNYLTVSLIISVSFIVGCAFGGVISYLAIDKAPQRTEAAASYKLSSNDTSNPSSANYSPVPTCRPVNTPIPTTDLCSNISGSEWKLVFKAVAELTDMHDTDVFKRDPYLVWERHEPYNEDIPQARELNNAYPDHYKSSCVLQWETANIVQVKVALLDHSGDELIALVFDGEGSNYMNWFSKSRLLSSPWDDVQTETQNHFSVLGENHAGRRFYINRNYGGCPNDRGWLCTVTPPMPICSFEKRSSRKPLFLYSLRKTNVNLNRFQDVGMASILAVFIKTADY